jgi:hypothetical protein
MHRSAQVSPEKVPNLFRSVGGNWRWTLSRPALDRDRPLFDLDLGHGVRLHADMLSAMWRGRLRLAVRTANLMGPAGVRVSSPATAWDAAGILGEDLQLTLV